MIIPIQRISVGARTPTAQTLRYRRYVPGTRYCKFVDLAHSVMCPRCCSILFTNKGSRILRAEVVDDPRILSTMLRAEVFLGRSTIYYSPRTIRYQYP